MSLGEFNGFLFHPGCAKVLKTVQSLLELSRDDLAYSWSVLRDFGNMSSPSVLFALAESMRTAPTPGVTTARATRHAVDRRPIEDALAIVTTYLPPLAVAATRGWPSGA